MLKKVKYARLHTGIFIPDVGDLGSTLPPKNKTFDLDMSYGELDGLEGLHIVCKGQALIVPPGNISLCVFAPETKVAPKAGK